MKLDKNTIENQITTTLDELLKDIEKDFSDPQKDPDEKREISIKIVIEMSQEEDKLAYVTIKGAKKLASTSTTRVVECWDENQEQFKEEDFE